MLKWFKEPELPLAKMGYTFVSHQQEVGNHISDEVTTVIQGGSSSVKALPAPTEEEQVPLRPDCRFYRHRLLIKLFAGASPGFCFDSAKRARGAG